jgi:AraC family L-rhamnose operon transcriptional activator RhaR/AraC family L-rhamnose operon regulatory protein RhaS
MDILKDSDHFHDINFPVNLYRWKDTDSHPMHGHEFTELAIIYGGSGTHIFQDIKYNIIQGDIFAINDNSIHGYENNQHLKHIDIIFKENFLFEKSVDIKESSSYHAFFHLEPFSRAQTNFSSKLHVSLGVLQEIMIQVDRIEDELKNKNEGYKTITLSLLQQIIVYLCRIYLNENNTGTIKLISIGRVINYLETHYEEDISLDLLSELSYLSKSSLIRHFQNSTGKTPIQYLMKLRIDKAKFFLKNSDLNITEISYKVGMNDSNYFSKLFKEITGFTPKEFRNKYPN